ncbi:replicative DNA helicase [Verrucomicrobiaceae bacterium N1E253]|uniref:Replicative DNA helicase n=1 Tax=Oceaniferula marina TaxID=2748318 RepID=A0A851GE24_9BACT|nr:replicative DNA helicase [Oceaniferula marina]NWK56018.1 replicative DNA helicase [Oceaniferula marina]
MATQTAEPFKKQKKEGPALQKAPENEEHQSAARALPHAIGPEKSLLSSMFQDPQEYIAQAIENKLTEEHFYLPAHGSLFRVMLEFFEKSLPIELVSLSQTLMDRDLMTAVGGPAAITEIYTYAPTHAHFSHHLEIVKDKYVLRSIISHCTEAISRAYEEQEEVESLLDNVEQQVLAIREGAEKQEGLSMEITVKQVLETFEDLISGRGQGNGLSTGYIKIDEMSSGLKAGEMFIIAARPSMGKTSFAMNLVEHICLDQGNPAMVFSLEMSSAQLVERLLYARARFAKSNITKGFNPSKADLLNVKKAAETIKDCKLFIDDTPSISINELRAKARRKKKEADIQVIAIDYLQLMRSNSKQAQNSREREVAEISAGLKALAKELEIPVIVLAQLNRGPEGRVGTTGGGGKPRMSDLRESGSIEQDADMVGLLYRSAYYADNEADRNERDGEAVLVIAKNRNGPTGDVPLSFIKEIMRFETREWRDGELEGE